MRIRGSIRKLVSLIMQTVSGNDVSIAPDADTALSGDVTLYIPDIASGSDTIITSAHSQTLENKTLEDPALTGGFLLEDSAVPSDPTGTDVTLFNNSGAISIRTPSSATLAILTEDDVLEALQDVVITTPANGQVLTYDNGDWVNDVIPFPEVLDLSKLTKIRSNKDSEGIFTLIEFEDDSSTRRATSELSTGVSPLYLLRTYTEYESDGVTVRQTLVFDQNYDIDDDWESEVLQ